MKNQYFGDINDYLKYGMLRVIGRATGLRIAVCWMLTENDSRTDGGKIGYLDLATKWRHYDPPLFDTLQAAVRAGRRNISVAEEEHTCMHCSHPMGQPVPPAGYAERLNRRIFRVSGELCGTASCRKGVDMAKL